MLRIDKLKWKKHVEKLKRAVEEWKYIGMDDEERGREFAKKNSLPLLSMRSRPRIGIYKVHCIL